jgi:tol-pal system protein YbgF
MNRQSYSAVKIKCFCSFAVLTTLIFVSACATNGDYDLLSQHTQQLQRDYQSLKADVEELKKGAATEESFHAVRQSQAEIQTLLSNILKDVQVLSGRFDENKYYVENTLKNTTTDMDLLKMQIASLENQVKEINTRINSLQSSTTTYEPYADEQIPPRGTESSLSPLRSGTKDEKYAAAYDAFQNKRYKESRKMFEQFIMEFPNEDLTDNAYFWLAETYYGEKDFENAILSYETLLKKYPDSQKVPGALLKQGFSFIEIGDKKTGQVILEQVIERFPNSREAEISKKKLQELK